MDDIAAEAGISRGLLFHYFPTKTDFYLACIAAAGRRMLRTTAPDEDLPGEAQVRAGDAADGRADRAAPRLLPRARPRPRRRRPAGRAR